MAEEEKKHDVKKDLVFVGVVLGILIVLWVLTGGPQKTNLQGAGFFINPSSPLQNPEYSPQIATSSPDSSY